MSVENRDNKPKNLGDLMSEISQGLAMASVRETMDSGKYITIHGGVNRKINKWGMEWPVGNLDRETVEYCIQRSRVTPLRMLVAAQVVQEAVALWREKKPEGYGTETNFRRTIPDVAINEGYIKAGQAILYPDVYTRGPQKGKTVADASLEMDPTGLDWLNTRLEELALVWNDIHESVPEYDTPEDPAVMGMRAGIERYKELYKQLVRAGAKPDESKSRFQQVFLKARRVVSDRLELVGLRVLEGTSKKIKRR